MSIKYQSLQELLYTFFINLKLGGIIYLEERSRNET